MSDYYSLSADLPRGMTDDRPSGIRVLAKSMHLLAFGWVVSIAWLWTAQVQLNIRRFASPPDGYALRTVAEGIMPALFVELMAIGMAALIARVPGSGDPHREWWHAFWWTLGPNLMLLGTAYLMIIGSR